MLRKLPHPHTHTHTSTHPSLNAPASRQKGYAQQEGEDSCHACSPHSFYSVPSPFRIPALPHLQSRTMGAASGTSGYEDVHEGWTYVLACLATLMVCCTLHHATEGRREGRGGGPCVGLTQTHTYTRQQRAEERPPPLEREPPHSGGAGGGEGTRLERILSPASDGTGQGNGIKDRQGLRAFYGEGVRINTHAHKPCETRHRPRHTH